MAVRIEPDNEIDTPIDRLALHQHIGQVVAIFDAGKFRRFTGNLAPAHNGSGWMQLHEGATQRVDDDVEGCGRRIVGRDAKTAGAARQDDANGALGAAGDANRFVRQAKDIGSATGPDDADRSGRAHQTPQVGIKVVKGAADTFTRVEDTIAAVDEMVINRQQHQGGIGHDAVQQTGVHCIIVGKPRLPMGIECFDEIGAIQLFHKRQGPHIQVASLPRRCCQ